MSTHDKCHYSGRNNKTAIDCRVALYIVKMTLKFSEALST